MKKRNMILAGILSASMMMSMGGAAAVYAEEATATEAAAAEESKSEETAAEKAETPAAEDAAGQTGRIRTAAARCRSRIMTAAMRTAHLEPRQLHHFSSRMKSRRPSRTRMML